MAEMRPLAIYPTDAVPVREMKSGDVLPVELLATALSLQLTGLNKTDPAVITAVDTILGALGKLQAQASNKVDKDGAKVLSDNNFTNAAMVKLANIAEQATKNASDADLRDRTTHTGAQAIGTVSGLQAALDAKETPAGALLQMQQFGLGVTVLSQTLANLDAPDIPSGFHRSVPATTGVKPTGTPTNAVVEVIRFNDKDCRQIYYGIGTSTQGKGVWVRHIAWNGTVSLPTPWIEQQSVDGSLAQMQGFGLGTAATPVLTDFTSVEAGGTYRGNGATSTAAGLPLNTGHGLINIPGDGTNSAQIAFPLTATGGRTRLFQRPKNLTQANPWQEFAFLTSTFPNLKIGNVASADANTLDFYEEGTFNPSIEGTATVGAATYSGRFGRYTRIGNRVFWTCRLTLTALGDMAGSVRLGGFPFITANTGGAEGSISVGFYQGLASGAEVSGMTGLHRAAANNANLYRISTVSKNTQALVVADISNNLSLYASGQYEV